MTEHRSDDKPSVGARESGGVEGKTPYDLLGGSEKVRAIAMKFYDHMSEHEPALARLHPCDDTGNVLPEPRERFALFFIGWLGGPQDYIEKHRHPRLRRRHPHLLVDVAMRDAWIRSMTAALDAENVTGPLRTFLDGRLFEVADFLRNA